MLLIMKLNPLSPTNLELVLRTSVEKKRSSISILQQAKNLTSQDRFITKNNFDFDQLETKNIFSL